MKKIKVAFFDLTGCEGCQFQLLSLDEHLFDFFQDFEITNWRLLSERKKSDFDIAVIEGAATTEKHVKLLKEIRETSELVVALGACAISGNVFAQLDPERRKEMAEKIYGPDYKLKAEFLEPVEKFVKVDKKIPGCPPRVDLFKSFLEEIKGQKITSKIKDVISPEYTAKIEGHGTLKINFKEKKADFEVEESERLVEGLLQDKPFQQAPFITSRICGICPIAHNVCSLSALEKAFGIVPSREAILLRRILLASQVIKSHLLHLFFLVLPDYAGLESSIELSKKYPAEFHLMLNIKRVADHLLRVVGGSSAFPTNTVVGGFKNPPQRSHLAPVGASISEVMDEAEDLVKLFYDLETLDFQVSSKLSTTIPSENFYPLYPGIVEQSFQSVSHNQSPVKLGRLENGESIKVGALARIEKYSDRLDPKAQKLLGRYKVDTKNPFFNNLAQAIEIFHFLEEIQDLIGELNKGNLQKATSDFQRFPKARVSGEAYIEAPRGILRHFVEVEDGKVKSYQIITPTQLNLSSLYEEIQALVKKDRLQEAEKKREIEKLIRAFDPCITCAVH
ncbi:MAG: hypothetical protein GF370_04755 [Candidatus Nealsonbacteria bacterium]|nr:hypothetical protein [Candidatus Nealsonbacteria bacterium]